MATLAEQLTGFGGAAPSEQLTNTPQVPTAFNPSSEGPYPYAGLPPVLTFDQAGDIEGSRQQELNSRGKPLYEVFGLPTPGEKISFSPLEWIAIIGSGQNGPNLVNTLRARKESKRLQDLTGVYSTAISKAVNRGDFDQAESYINEFNQFGEVSPNALRIGQSFTDTLNKKRTAYQQNNATLDAFEAGIGDMAPESYKKAAEVVRRNAANFNPEQIKDFIAKEYPQLIKTPGGIASVGPRGEVMNTSALPEFATAGNIPDAVKRAFELNSRELSNYGITSLEELANLYNRVNGKNPTSTDLALFKNIIQPRLFGTAERVATAPLVQPGIALAERNLRSSDMTRTFSGGSAQEEALPSTPSVAVIRKDGTKVYEPFPVSKQEVQDFYKKLHNEGSRIAEESIGNTPTGLVPVRGNQSEATSTDESSTDRNPLFSIVSSAEAKKEAQKQAEILKAKNPLEIAPDSQMYFIYYKTTKELRRAEPGTTYGQLSGYASMATPQMADTYKAYEAVQSNYKIFLDKLKALSPEEKNPRFFQGLSDTVKRALATGLQIGALGIDVSLGSGILNERQAALYEASVALSRSLQPFLTQKDTGNASVATANKALVGAFTNPTKIEASARGLVEVADKQMERLVRSLNPKAVRELPLREDDIRPSRYELGIPTERQREQTSYQEGQAIREKVNKSQEELEQYKQLEKARQDSATRMGNKRIFEVKPYMQDVQETLRRLNEKQGTTTQESLVNPVPRSPINKETQQKLRGMNGR